MATDPENSRTDARTDGRSGIAPGCPTAEELLRRRTGELPDAEVQRIVNHLTVCDDCTARDSVLAERHEAWVGRIRSVAPRLRQRDTGAAPPLLPGEDVIPGYRVVGEIARGGQGVVYRAVQLSTRREVAIKLLQGTGALRGRDRRRFELEIELAAGLQHPNIVHVMDSGVLPGDRRFVVMEYIRGAPLLEYARGERLTLVALLRLFAELCDGVNHAHQSGVLHRDLKPSNVLVDEQGRPRILDFGLARALDRPSETKLTLTAQIGGTLPYMSPEQARGLHNAGDIRSDVYSLGVMLYELLTGRLPYSTDGDIVAALHNIVDAVIAPPSRALRGAAPSTHSLSGLRLDSELDTIVLCALSKEPQRRYQTAGALADELRCYLSGQPIAARRDSTWYVLRKSLRRHRLAVGLSLILLVTITAATIALGWMYLNQRRLSEEARSAASTAGKQAIAARTAEQSAERRFQELRELARVFIYELDPLIQRLPGARPAREKIVATGLRYLDALAAQAAGDSAMQFELAYAYLRIGDVQGDVQSASGDDLDAALASYRRAVEILDGLSEKLPQNADVVRQRVAALNKIGQVLEVAGRRREASDAFESARVQAQAALRAFPEDASLIRSLGAAHERLGNHLRSDDPLQAEAHYRESMGLAERLAATAPEDLWLQRDLAVGHTKLANLLADRGDREGALRHYDMFLQTAEALLAAHPDDVAARVDVLTGRQWCGILLGEMQKHEEALAEFQRAIEVGNSLERDGFPNLAAVHSHATTFIKCGEIQILDGRIEAARGSFERSLALLEPRAAEHPMRNEIQRLLGVAQYKMIEYHRARAQAPGILDAQRAAHWRSAADWAERCRVTFVGMRERGILSSSDASVPDDLAQEVRSCLTVADGLQDASGNERNDRNSAVSDEPLPQH